MWWSVTNHKVALERNAFAEACKRLTATEIKQIVGNIHAYKAFLLKKQKNMKNGGRTHPVIKGLINCLVAQKGNGMELADSQESMSVKPAKAIADSLAFSSTSKPEAANAMDTELAKAVEIRSPSPKPAKATSAAHALVLDFDTPKSYSPGVKSVVSVSSSDVMSARKMAATQKKGLQASSKKPAAHQASMKKPAKAKSGKASKPEKAAEQVAPAAPAEEPGKAERKKRGEKRSWVASQSFGFIHETRAREKAYIRAKPAMADKAECLVNVNVPAGQKQTEIMDVLFQTAQEAGWTKEQLVTKKNELVTNVQCFS
eukprot:Skav210371  [mRNA]  locus=scaffold1357:485887:486831:- [translate_table: standard]